MKIDKDDITNSIYKLLFYSEKEREDEDVIKKNFHKTVKIMDYIWPIIEHLNRRDPVVMLTEECVKHKPEPDFTDEDILDEMEADMNQWGVAQGEIESMRQDWRNRFFIVRRER